MSLKWNTLNQGGFQVLNNQAKRMVISFVILIMISDWLVLFLHKAEFFYFFLISYVEHPMLIPGQ